MSQQSLSRQTVSRRMVLAAVAATAFAALTALGARLQFHLPFTPVPVTGQVFCVLLAGAALGPRLGCFSMLQYLAAGAVGLPVFAYGGGPAALMGPTGGYLAGFPVAALAVGAAAGPSGTRAGGRTLLACLLGVAVIYLFGASWYAVWCVALGQAAGLAAILLQSVFPFVLVDFAKAGLAAAIAPQIRHRVPFL